MNTMELVRFVERAHPRRSAPATPAPFFPSELFGPARQAILRARQLLLGEQRDEGAWLGAQAGNVSLAGQLILLLAYLDRERTQLAQQAAATLLDKQSPTGGWSVQPDGVEDVSTSIQCYFALKLIGLEPSDERMSRARQAIRQLGGADAADATSRFFLALFGQIEYDRCPAAPPERLLVDSRDRKRHAPLSLIWSHRPVRNVGIERGVRELFLKKPSEWAVASQRPTDKSQPHRRKLIRALRTFFWQYCEHHGFVPLRRRALERAESLVLQHIEPMQIAQLDFRELLWHTIALDAVGYLSGSFERKACEARLHEMVCIEPDSEQASPRLRTTKFADTLVALRALRASGMSGRHPCIAAASKWLSQSRRTEFSPNLAELAGVVQILNEAPEHNEDARSALPPGIEVSNAHWDADSVDAANRRLDRLRSSSAALIDQLLQRQNRDGGWGPVDITAMVVDAVAVGRCEHAQAAIGRAVRYLRQVQRADGSWSGSSGDVHATSLAIRGLLAAGVPADEDAVVAGINWLIVEQRPSGGWGESPSQTALALLALILAGQAQRPPALRAVNYLLQTQQDDGGWSDPQFVLHDAAAKCSFRNDLHAVAWPLEALSRWAVAAAPNGKAAEPKKSLRLVAAMADD